MFTQLFHDIEVNNHNSKSCIDCNTTITFGRAVIKDPDTIRWVIPAACKNAGYSQRVCEGTLDRMADPLAYLFQHSKITTPEMCSTLLSPDCMTYLGLPFSHAVNWELTLPKPKPFVPKSGNDKQLKMLHLTDIHLDLYYTPGSNSVCDEPICCRSTSYGHNHSAGYWSETTLNCDSPLIFTEDAIGDVAQTHKDLDFVIWTGDNIPHDVWNTTKIVNLKHVEAVTDMFKKSFPDKPIFSRKSVN
ncbi:unnamed protein product, partial [Oppiella nova]